MSAGPPARPDGPPTSTSSSSPRPRATATQAETPAPSSASNRPRTDRLTGEGSGDAAAPGDGPGRDPSQTDLSITTSTRAAADEAPPTAGSSSSILGRIASTVRPPKFTRSRSSNSTGLFKTRSGGRARSSSGTPSPAVDPLAADDVPPVPPLPPAVVEPVAGSSTPHSMAEPTGSTGLDRKGKGRDILSATPPGSAHRPAGAPSPSPSKEKKDPFGRFRPFLKRSKSGARGPDAPQISPPPLDDHGSAANGAAAATAATGQDASGAKATNLTVPLEPLKKLVSGGQQRSATTGGAIAGLSRLSPNLPVPPKANETLSPAPLTSSLASALTTYLTQPALLTLSQLAPSQLFALRSYDHASPTSSALPLSEAESLTRDHVGSPVSARARSGSRSSTSTETAAAPTVEQLSASSLALPTTSIVGLWRLLKCVDWVREKERDLAAVSLPGASNPPHSTDSDCFDVANLLQNVGDILSSVSAAAGVEMVFFHVFYPPRPEAEADPEPSTGPGRTRPTTGASAMSENEDPVLVGAGIEGEGGMREISVKGDERGLTIGLTCLLRQVLSKSRKGSTIEVGLHLTPLTAGSDEPRPGNDADVDPVSWRCIFDVALTTPDPRRRSVPLDEATTSADQPNPQGSGRGRISANPLSELPAMPSSQGADTIFKYLGMQLTTGRVTSRGHSWKISARMPRGRGRAGSVPSHGEGASRRRGSVDFQASCEPTAEDLTTFAETALRSKKVLLFAAEHSVFAKHLTCYLASWGTDMSHMPYDRSALATGDTIPDPPRANKFDGRASLSRHDSGFGGSSQMESPPSALLSPSIASSIDPLAAAGAAGTKSDSQSATPTSPSYDPSTHFIIIDDDIPTLRAQLLSLRNASPQMHLQLGFPGGKVRPGMSRRSKSSNHVKTVMGQLNTCILHFTSISKYSLVKEVVRTILSSTQWMALPEVLVIPKPVGPRRVLTALHTAVRRPVIEAQFQPIATSPSSPGSQYYFVNTLARPSPALSTVGQDFDSAAAAYNKAASETGQEAVAAARTPPITVPGTPSTAPSPNLLSHEALEYFARAASESGGSSSTGVVLQSPDGRPQAMFFHHAASSHRVPSQRSRRGDSQGKTESPKLSREAFSTEESEDPTSGDGTTDGNGSARFDDRPTMRRGKASSADIPARAMTLDKFEAVAPTEDTPPSSQTSKGTLVPPRGPPKPSLLRMPSVQASAATTPTSRTPPAIASSPPRSHLSRVNSASEGGRATPAAPVPTRKSTGRRSSSTITLKNPKRKAPKKPQQVIVPPVRVLIVEDNPINQTILAMYLRRKNVYHEIAKDGQQAIDKWRAGHFHLVLMDIQLPIKDGIQATKEIREMERKANITAFANTPPAEPGSLPVNFGTPSTTSPRNSSVIIVALTASSLDKDRDIALAAGCNDFLTKPVNLDWLNQKLLEWGSMAWLSGFSRLMAGAADSGSLASPASNSSIKGFVGPSAERRSKEIAEHLHLRTRPGSGNSTNSSLPVTPRVTDLQQENQPAIAVQKPTPEGTPQNDYSPDTPAEAIQDSAGTVRAGIDAASTRLENLATGRTSHVSRSEQRDAVAAGAREAKREKDDADSAGNSADREGLSSSGS